MLLDWDSHECCFLDVETVLVPFRSGFSVDSLSSTLFDSIALEDEPVRTLRCMNDTYLPVNDVFDGDNVDDLADTADLEDDRYIVRLD